MADSLRVRAGLLSDLEEGSIALLPKEDTPVEITMEERKAVLTNGKITAVMEVLLWGNVLQMTFCNQKGEVLLKEISNGGALSLRARHYKTLPEGTSI